MNTRQPEQPGSPAGSQPPRVVDSEDRPFWEALDRGQLTLARCLCGACYARSQACLSCGGTADALRWVSVSGRGHVRTYVVFDKPYHPYFAARLPYCVAVVALEEGPEIVTNVIECAPDAVFIGQEVEVFAAVRDGQVLPQARPR